MKCFTIASVLATVIMSSANLGAEEAPTEFKLHSIGHVEKTEGQTRIVLNEKYQPGLLGVDGYSHINMIWWFDKNDTPEKRATLQVHPMGNRENPLRDGWHSA